MLEAMNNYAVQNVMLKFFECKKQEVESGNLQENEQFKIDLSVLGDLIVKFRDCKGLVTSIDKVNFEQLEKTVEFAEKGFENKLETMNLDESDELDVVLLPYISKMKAKQRKIAVETIENLDEYNCDKMIDDKESQKVSIKKAIKSGEDLEIINTFVNTFDKMLVDFCLRQAELRNEIKDQDINNNVR